MTNENTQIWYWQHNKKDKVWSCWTYPAVGFDFDTWMEENCPTAECIFRFNSGDPMYTVRIHDPTEATVFILKFNVNQ
jgi:hypothetical protein